MITMINFEHRSNRLVNLFAFCRRQQRIIITTHVNKNNNNKKKQQQLQRPATTKNDSTPLKYNKRSL